MAKQVHPGEEIYIAKYITGKRDDSGKLVITDVSTTGREQLNPDLCIEDKIIIFERQVNGWFLDPASALVEKEDNGFIVLMIATAYIEGVEQYRQGKSSNKQSNSFFKKGVKRIFQLYPLYDHRLDRFYSELRCGLFHNGMTGPNIRIQSELYDKPIDFSDKNITKINQKLFLEKVREDFKKYLADLRNRTETELRDHFNNMYKFDNNSG